MTDTIIDVSNLTKYYGSIRGVENVSFQVNKGEIHGFLGPNGSGKTTTIRILTGLLKATDGIATIEGLPAGSIEAKKKIGYLPSEFSLYSHYRVGEYLNYIAKLRGGAPLMDELVKDFNLDLSRKTKELSTGNKQKVSIVQALMHDPEIIIGDEPTSGLDPIMQAEFGKYMRKFAKQGKTIFLSSHILTEVQDICDVVTIIREGDIVKSGNVDKLLEEVPRKAIIKKSNGISLEELAQQLNAKVGNDVQDRLVLYFDYSVKEFARKICEIDSVEDFTIPEPDLEEYFLNFYEK